MMPAAIVLPAAVPPGIFGAAIDPSVVLGFAAAAAVAGTAGLCVALVRDAFERRRKPAITIIRRERIAA